MPFERHMAIDFWIKCNEQHHPNDFLFYIRQKHFKRIDVNENKNIELISKIMGQIMFNTLCNSKIEWKPNCSFHIVEVVTK